jgi:hypothetical protein
VKLGSEQVVDASYNNSHASCTSFFRPLPSSSPPTLFILSLSLAFLMLTILRSQYVHLQKEIDSGLEFRQEAGTPVQDESELLWEGWGVSVFFYPFLLVPLSHVCGLIAVRASSAFESGSCEPADYIESRLRCLHLYFLCVLWPETLGVR